MNRALLADMIGDDYEILEAENGLQGIAQMQALGTGISLVLLDIVMPEMDGFDVLAVMNKNEWIKDIPVIMVSSESASSYIERAYELGVTDFISRPFDANIVRRRVVNTLMLYAKQKALIGMVADQIYEREKGNSLMVAILSHIVEFRNGESGLHVLHVGAMTELLLNHVIEKTDRYNLTPADVSLISMASSLHDIGKISIPDEVLNKPGRLTDEEFDLMKQHTVIGSEMLDDLPMYRDEPLVQTAYEICRWHHERYDGRGYPDGLAGEDIPIAAQVVALADVYDALTSKRVYKDAYSHDKAIEMILNGECGAFNPFLLECLTDIANDVQAELHVASFSNHTDHEIRKIVDKVVRPDAASSRTLELLDYERMKYRFFASMSNEVQYEYTVDPPMLAVSDWGASGLDLDEIIMDPLNDAHLREAFGEDTITMLREALHATTPDEPVIEFDIEATVNGQLRWFHVTSRAIWTDDEVPQYHGSIGKMVDIHESHERLMELQYKATHDSLTGLMNHPSARQAVTDRMAMNPEDNFVFMVIDLDLFKQANDTRGHQFGDEVLRHLARRLLASVRDRDVVARVGGDEFFICMECQVDPEPLVERVYRSIIGEYEGFPLSVSIGVACTQGDEHSYDEMFRKADAALYDMKRGGRGGYLLSDLSAQDEGKTALSAIDGGQSEEKE
ncbi:MAG: diguanylate cyclase [Eggerthellaceae bacterium]|nr:diguanylate cyclase [Eggerthellaceae bacterium]